MNGWICGCLFGWIDRWLDEWIVGYFLGWMDELPKPVRQTYKIQKIPWKNCPYKE